MTMYHEGGPGVWDEDKRMYVFHSVVTKAADTAGSATAADTQTVINKVLEALRKDGTLPALANKRNQYVHHAWIADVTTNTDGTNALAINAILAALRSANVIATD